MTNRLPPDPLPHDHTVVTADRALAWNDYRRMALRAGVAKGSHIVVGCPRCRGIATSLEVCPTRGLVLPTCVGCGLELTGMQLAKYPEARPGDGCASCIAQTPPEAT